MHEIRKIYKNCQSLKNIWDAWAWMDDTIKTDITNRIRGSKWGKMVNCFEQIHKHMNVMKLVEMSLA